MQYDEIPDLVLNTTDNSNSRLSGRETGQVAPQLDLECQAGSSMRFGWQPSHRFHASLLPILTAIFLAVALLALTAPLPAPASPPMLVTASPPMLATASPPMLATASPPMLATASAPLIPSSLSPDSLSFPIRLAFYYPWYPEAWSQDGITPNTRFHPTLGYYDSSNPAVIAEHIAAMQYGNIEAGIASWWGQGTNTDQRLPLLLQAAQDVDFRWSVYYEPEGQSDPSVAQIRADLEYLQSIAEAQPAFLRVDGRFVVFVNADPEDGCQMAARWSAANTVQAYLVLKVFPGYQGCASQPDGWHAYNPTVAAESETPYSYSISPGFWKVGEDERLPRDLQRWRQNVQDMVASGARFQLITTFNQWGEGTSVEASVEWSQETGYGYFLDALHAVDNPRLPPSPSPSPSPPPPPSASPSQIYLPNVLKLVAFVGRGSPPPTATTQPPATSELPPTTEPPSATMVSPTATTPATTQTSAPTTTPPGATQTPTTSEPPPTTEPPTTTAPPSPTTPAPTPTATPTTAPSTASATPNPGGQLLAVGDIADCNRDEDEQVAALVEKTGGRLATLGDTVYPDGSAAEFQDCYDPAWGQFLPQTRPAIGNHDYHTDNAAPYFAYFGSAAGDPDKGYYSYDLGGWHVVVLNGNCSKVGGCDSNSPQAEWLRQDLAAHPAACTLAYWHQPRFSSALHGDNTNLQDFWQILYDSGAELVLNGHDHDYERFAPQDPQANRDRQRGIREFVAGTGGKSSYDFTDPPDANSEVRLAHVFGVLKLNLEADGYTWQFLQAPNGEVLDSGSDSCH